MVRGVRKSGVIILIKVEQEPVHKVLDDGPEAEAEQPHGDDLEGGLEALAGQVGSIRDTGQPEDRDDIPRGLGQRLEDVAKERGRFAALVVAGAVHLVEVEFFGEATEPNLGEERSAQVQELVCLVVLLGVRVHLHVLGAGHAGPLVNLAPLLVNDHLVLQGGHNRRCSALLRGMSVAIRRRQETDQRVVEDLIGSLAVGVGVLVLEDIGDILASVVEDELCAAGVGIEEIGHVVDVGTYSDVAGLSSLVRLDLGDREGREVSARHGLCFGRGERRPSRMRRGWQGKFSSRRVGRWPGERGCHRQTTKSSKQRSKRSDLKTSRWDYM